MNSGHHPSAGMPTTSDHHSNAHSQSFHDHHPSNNIHRASDLLVSVSSCMDANKAKIISLASAASEELSVMAQEREPLWLFDFDRGTELLNVGEYNRRFTALDPTLEEIIRVIAGGTSDSMSQSDVNGHTLASRATGIVFRDPISLVNMFMDVHEWSAMFSNIISKANTLAVLSKGSQESPDGALQVMVAEFHIPSPLIKTREMYFARYSRQIDINTWVVADVSLEAIFPSPVATCQRKPSGCIIQALQHGLSTVTWVEHNTDCNGADNHILVSGSARWMSSLERQCDRMATLAGQNDTLNYLSTNQEGLGAAKNGLLKLAGRMVRHFNLNIFSNVESVWRPLPIPGAEEILIKTSFNLDNPEIPHGVAIIVATSICVPASQNDVINFLRTEHNRNKWDILSQGLQIQDVMCISSARNSTDCVSVVSIEPSSTKTSITYLQESFSDSVAYYLIYAPIDIPTMQHILQGGRTDEVAILPSGFVVLPGSLPTQNSILTVGFQIMDEQLRSPEELTPQSELIAYRLMKETISQIWAAVCPKSQKGSKYWNE